MLFYCFHLGWWNANTRGPFCLCKTLQSCCLKHSDLVPLCLTWSKWATIHANSVKHTPRMMSAHCSLLLIFINRLCHAPSIPQAMDTLKSKCDFDLSKALQEMTLYQYLQMHFNVIGLTNTHLLDILIKQEDIFL